MHAPAVTGPNNDPRPTSSTPATSVAPTAHAAFSNFCVHFKVFSRRSLAAECEIPRSSAIFVIFDFFRAMLTIRFAETVARHNSSNCLLRCSFDLCRRSFRHTDRGEDHKDVQ